MVYFKENIFFKCSSWGPTFSRVGAGSNFFQGFQMIISI